MTEFLHISFCLTLQIVRPATAVAKYMEPLPDYWLMVPAVLVNDASILFISSNESNEVLTQQITVSVSDVVCNIVPSAQYRKLVLH